METPNWFKGWIRHSGIDYINTDFGRYEVSREPIEIYGWNVQLVDQKPLHIYNHQFKKKVLYERVTDDNMELEFNKLCLTKSK